MVLKNHKQSDLNSRPYKHHSLGIAMKKNQSAVQYLLYIMSHQRALSAGVQSKEFETNNNKGQKLHTQTDSPQQLQKARAHFFKALKASGSNAYAQSAIHHNLGILHNAHYGRLPGGNVENLMTAKSYLEKAINCEERKKFPDRHAHSLTQLAVTWRKAAQEHLWPDSSEVCYKNAEKLNYQALKCVSDKCPLPAVLAAQAQVLMNLSTVLLDQDKNEEACAAAYDAYRMYMEACKLIRPAPLMTEMDMPQLLILTFSRLTHLGEGLQHYKKVCDEILKLAPEYDVTEDQLYFTVPNVDGNNLEIEIYRLIMMIKKNPSQKNIEAGREKALQLYRKRMSAQTDQAADDTTRYIQMLVSAISRGLVHNERLIEAFVVLENASAMRFTESQSAVWFAPETKIPLALYQIKRQLGSLYYAMNEAIFFFHVHDSQKDRSYFFERSIEGFDKLYESKTELEGAGIIFNSSTYPKIFKKAALSEEPDVVLAQASQAVLDDFKKIEQQLTELYPKYKKNHDDIFSITPRHVEQVFRNHPDLTLLKIDQESGHNDLLLIAVYQNEGKVCSKNHTISAPSELSNTIYDTVIRSQKNGVNEWKLDFINWKKVLPSGKRKVAILPSYFAAHIPWAATGVHGKRLLDLVDEVLWLPSVLSLCYKAKLFRQRTHSVRLSGGGTLYTKHAHSGQEYDDFSSTSPKEVVLKQIANAEVLSFYGHAEHDHPDRPKLLFEDFSIYGQQLGHEACGMKRVELWACQSGSNIPQMFMGSPVNEAFGMDMKMLEFGAETAIGTLWPVPELVTSHIKRYYDNLVASGVEASKALIQAQRWWINSGADQQLSLIRKIGVKQYLKSLGYEGSTKSGFSAVMGPVLATKANDNSESLTRGFKHPFIGTTLSIKH